MALLYRWCNCRPLADTFHLFLTFNKAFPDGAAVLVWDFVGAELASAGAATALQPVVTLASPANTWVLAEGATFGNSLCPSSDGLQLAVGSPNEDGGRLHYWSLPDAAPVTLPAPFPIWLLVAAGGGLLVVGGAAAAYTTMRRKRQQQVDKQEEEDTTTTESSDMSAELMSRGIAATNATNYSNVSGVSIVQQVDMENPQLGF